ncbi:DUF3325 domain-containing protein [Paracidovorax cattleyae]|uniref:DUF3325 domain-containing protein n=1 Tax=Paracidovorax cattleyae TaxID=80868 RepID=UPI000B8A3310|nr:DUF3325 domain-containing protein [Paracidovorax cattleyae]AVS74679.1 DUF3325 domain-containing protein [Paracidovorax cattleyae]MBF9266594.1 DUF3325 domain-containing protein [Paracidovorax cattleyae]
MTVWLVIAVSFCAFACLGSAMERHVDDVLRGVGSRWLRLFLRSFGVFLLTAALLLCTRSAGTSVGITIWLGALTVAACTVAIFMTYGARWLPYVALTAMATAGGLVWAK